MHYFFFLESCKKLFLEIVIIVGFDLTPSLCIGQGNVGSSRASPRPKIRP